MKMALLKNAESKNAIWLICSRVIQMILSLFVSIISARYLGPSNYGLISYGIAYVSLFTSLCNLGINSVIIKNFYDKPEDEGLTIGTSIVLRILSGVFSAISIFGISLILDYGETITIVVVCLCSASLVVQALDTFSYWFQSRYQSKKTAIATLIAFIVTSSYKILLLVLNKSVIWFAAANALDYLVLGLLLFAFFKMCKGPKLRFSWIKGRELLRVSYHYILSGAMVAIYGQTDKLMLKQMLNETSVGYYAIATSVCGVWTFVLTAIIDSMYPTILKLKEVDDKEYIRKNQQLYCIVFYISVFVSVCFLLLGRIAIRILYGNDYLPASRVLMVITWYTAFAYLGVARNAWMVCEGKQKYLKWMYLFAAIINVGLNFALIPFLHEVGAALASLITQLFTSIVLPMMWKGTRPNSIMMLRAIAFGGVFRHSKRETAD